MVFKFKATWKVLRYPVVFGSCVGAYFLAFSYRKEYFHDEIEHKRKENFLHSQEEMARIEAAKQQVLSKRREKGQNS